MLLNKLLVSLCLLSSSAFAYDFTEAKRLFDLRGEGNAAIDQAIAAYEQAFAVSLSETELVHASESLARLNAYKANLIPRARIAERAPLYANCVNAIRRLEPTNPHVEYYFWFGACKMLGAEAQGVPTALRSSKEVMDALVAGKAIDATYEGGGFDRVMGGMYAKLPPFNPWGPAGDVNKSIQHLEAAIASPAWGGAEFPETASGDFFYETYFYYAQALDAARRRPDAIAQLETALDRIAGGEVSENRVPETKVVEQLMQELLAQLRGDAN